MAKIVTTLPDAKARMSRARDLARKADPLSAALFDRWYAETLMSARGARDESACAMLAASWPMPAILKARDRGQDLPEPRTRA
jgi:hypothetical protein